MGRKWVGFWTALAVFGIVGLVAAGILGIHLPRWQGEHALDALSRQLEQLSDDQLRHHKNLARWYNLCLSGRVAGDFENAYPKLLRMGEGMLAVLELPEQARCYPVFHGEEGNNGAGVTHLPGTALPVGGSGNHTVLLGPKIFSQLREGEILVVHSLEDTLVYRVSRVRKVLPGQTEGMLPVAGEDLLTLITAAEDNKYMIHASRAQTVWERQTREYALPEREVCLGLLAAGLTLFFPVFTGLAGRIIRGISRKWAERKEKLPN